MAFCGLKHYSDIIMGTTASQITSLTIVLSTVYSDADQRKHQSSVSLAFLLGIHRGPVNSPHKWPVTWKMFPFDDVIMNKRQSASQHFHFSPLFLLINSLPPATWASNFKSLIYKLIIQNSGLATCHKVVLRWMPQNTLMISQQWFSLWFGANR